MTDPAAEDVDGAEVSKEEKEDQSMTAVSDDEASNKKEDVDDDDSKKEDAAETEEEEKEELPKKTKIVDWPLRDIAEPHPNDVMYGRGGEYTRETGA
jgi:hypothetical protein